MLEPGIPMPYGLSHVQAIDVTAAGGLAGVADQLREQVAQMRAQQLPPQSAAEPGTGPGRRDDGCDHFQLHARLCRLTDVIFEQIVFHADIDRAVIAPRTAPLAERALDVAQLAALDRQLCRRLSAELDRRAPWTRS